MARHTGWGLQDLLELTEEELMEWLETTRNLLAEQHASGGQGIF